MDEKEMAEPGSGPESPVDMEEGFAGTESILAPSSSEPPQQKQPPQHEGDPPQEHFPEETKATTQPPPNPPVDEPRPKPVPASEPPVKLAPQSQPKAQSSGGASARPIGQDGPQDKKAREFIQQAEKKIKSSQSFLGSLFGGTAKMEDAADLYVRAANAYKVGKKYKAAGLAFIEAANIHQTLDTKHEAASNLVEAGQVLKKEDAREATECYLRAVEIYTDMGRFSLAARYHSTVAEIFETEVQDYEEAITHYELAADFYKGEDSIGSANKALLKVAHMCATLQNYAKAADLFEEIGKVSLGNTLLKYAAKDYFFKAGLCHFCIGPQNAKEAISRYRQLHPGFEGTRELKLIQDLFVTCDEEDTDKFADIVKDYDAISRLDAWITALLLHIKKAISATPDHV